MNTLIALLIFIIIIGVFGILMTKMSKFMCGKRIYWVFGGYITILLICFILDTVNPSKEMADLKKVDINALEQENTQLYNAAAAGKLDRTGDKYINKRWSFNYDAGSLNLKAENGSSFGTMIVVERKKTNDGKIEATYYKARSSIDDQEITHLVHQIGVKLSSDTLLLVNPKQVKLKFSQFENVFTIQQFTGEKWFSHHSNFTEGQSVLYLRIPKSLRIIDQSNLNIVYTP